jgi:hypothetical protein
MNARGILGSGTPPQTIDPQQCFLLKHLSYHAPLSRAASIEARRSRAGLFEGLFHGADGECRE